MGHKEKAAYLGAIRLRYAHAGRKSKKLILDEFCAVCGFNRKYAKNWAPFQLKKRIEQKLKTIFKNVSVTSIVRHRI